MIDTHSHLDFKDFDKDRDEVIARFFNKNGRFIITVGVNKKRNEKALDIAQKDKRIFATLAYHPEDADKIKSSDAIIELKKLLDNKQYQDKIVAMGEIGLDYFWIKNKKNKKELKQKQKELFKEQLNLAIKYKKPVVIHCREAYEDVYEIIKATEEAKKLKKVIHCYQGNLLWTEKFLKISNLFFSFTGNITFEKKAEAEIFEVLKTIPLDRIMAETDAPFLAPVPYRGKRNEPVYVVEVIKQIASIKKMNFNKVEEQIDKNAINFFDLKR